MKYFWPREEEPNALYQVAMIRARWAFAAARLWRQPFTPEVMSSQALLDQLSGLSAQQVVNEPVHRQPVHPDEFLVDDLNRLLSFT